MDVGCLWLGIKVVSDNIMHSHSSCLLRILSYRGTINITHVIHQLLFQKQSSKLNYKYLIYCKPDDDSVRESSIRLSRSKRCVLSIIAGKRCSGQKRGPESTYPNTALCTQELVLQASSAGSEEALQSCLVGDH